MTWPHAEPDRIMGCLLGGAIGDALGAPIERKSLAEIRATYGADGLREYGSERVSEGAITDDTQLTLFTAEALIQASIRARAKGIGGATVGLLQRAYLRWLHTQGEEIPQLDIGGQDWLFDRPEMHARRGPGRTCLSALHKVAARGSTGDPMGTVEDPINDSKGCGGVMRAAPVGFATAAATAKTGSFELGCASAALTHGHPSGYLPAGVLATMVWGLVRGASLAEALELARTELEARQRHQEVTESLEKAVVLAGRGVPGPEKLQSLGAGWTGDEALAIAVYAALAAEGQGGSPVEIGRRGLLLAVNHSGDSDSTGSICGNLLGARYGTAALPGRWQAGVELRDIIVMMAADLALEFGPNPPSDDYGGPPSHWYRRHPA